MCHASSFVACAVPVSAAGGRPGSLAFDGVALCGSGSPEEDGAWGLGDGGGPDCGLANSRHDALHKTAKLLSNRAIRMSPHSGSVAWIPNTFKQMRSTEENVEKPGA